jgi:hypothetical protein
LSIVAPKPNLYVDGLLYYLTQISKVGSNFLNFSSDLLAFFGIYNIIAADFQTCLPSAYQEDGRQAQAGNAD